MGRKHERCARAIGVFAGHHDVFVFPNYSESECFERSNHASAGRIGRKGDR
jgi:hypothetical protein